LPQSAPARSTTVADEYDPPAFVCSWRIGGWDAAWVQVAGELDLATSPQLRERLAEAQRAVRLVVLDLRALCFIDCSGVHVILDAAHDARRYAGRLLIVRGPAAVDRMLTLTEVSEQVVIFDLAATEPTPAPARAHAPGVAA
jgi:anti-sigma B factor antagonist